MCYVYNHSQANYLNLVYYVIEQMISVEKLAGKQKDFKTECLSHLSSVILVFSSSADQWGPYFSKEKDHPLVHMHKWIRPFGGVSFFPNRWRERSHRRSGNNVCFPLTTCPDKHKSQTLVGRKLGHLVLWARNGTAARENIPQPAASCICFSSKPATFCTGAHW